MDPSTKRQLPSPGSDDTNTPNILDGTLIRSWPRMYGLEGFYAAPPSSDPYVPGLRTNPEAYNEMSRGMSTYGVSRSHVHYQCGDMPPPSDSGYSSRAKHSIADTSVYDGVDRSQDTQSITGHMSDFHPFAPMPTDKFGQGTPGSHRDFPHGAWLSQPVPMSSRSRHESTSSGLVCPTCGMTVKNKSEIKKHEQRHMKPHKCDVQGCNRKQGFSTVNDLDRHKKCVHSLEGTRYQCRIGPCSSKDKTWPRADNFRSHLKRVHGQEISADGDLSEFHYTPPQAPVLEGVGDFAYTTDYSSIMSNTYWTNQRPTQIDVPPQHDLDVSEPTSASLSDMFPAAQRGRVVTDEHQRDEPAAGEQCNVSTMASISPVLMQSAAHLPLTHHVGPFGDRNFTNTVRLESDPLIGSGSDIQGLEADLVPHAVQEDNFVARHTRPSPLRVESQGSDIIESVEGKHSAASTSDVSMMEDGGESVVSHIEEEDDEKERKPSISSLPPFTDVQSLRKFLETVPEDLLDEFIQDRSQQTLKKATTTPSVVSGEAPKYTCPNESCKKTFPRQCELKKHQKRHEKPYGCTFRDCEKTFGSKNDWKRHEGNQHAQLETWKCHELDGTTDGAPCSKVFARREQFKHHLQAHHGIHSEQRVEKELSERRIGRDGDSSFWCGFCVEIISISSRDVHARTERFNHIDEHFCGKNQDGKRTIAEWKHIDDTDVRDVDTSAATAAAATAQASRPGKKRAAENSQPPRVKRQR